MGNSRIPPPNDVTPCVTLGNLYVDVMPAPKVPWAIAVVENTFDNRELWPPPGNLAPLFVRNWIDPDLFFPVPMTGNVGFPGDWMEYRMRFRGGEQSIGFPQLATDPLRQYQDEC